MFLQTLAMVAEFEADLEHLRTCEGMALAKRNDKLKGKLPAPTRRSIRCRYAEGEVPLADLATEQQRRPLHHPPHHPRAADPAESTISAARRELAGEFVGGAGAEPADAGTQVGKRAASRSARAESPSEVTCDGNVFGGGNHI
ncbi:hypothetical protein [Actinomadura nitritigenes]|uniref:hypothetical protein n=1 Tax=Actinomadura nitritigenes TaxID=134602 RepID=UPI003D8B5A59